MDLLPSNGSPISYQGTPSNNRSRNTIATVTDSSSSSNSNNNSNSTTDHLLAGILESLPNWNIMPNNVMHHNDAYRSSHSNDYFLNNILSSLDATNDLHAGVGGFSTAVGGGIGPFDAEGAVGGPIDAVGAVGAVGPIDIFGAVGGAVGPVDAIGAVGGAVGPVDAIGAVGGAIGPVDAVGAVGGAVGPVDAIGAVGGAVGPVDEIGAVGPVGAVDVAGAVGPVDAVSTVNNVGNVQVAQLSSELLLNGSNIICNWCTVSAAIRCLECNEFMCSECLREHSNSPLGSKHAIISLPENGESPNGEISTGTTTSTSNASATSTTSGTSSASSISGTSNPSNASNYPSRSSNSSSSSNASNVLNPSSSSSISSSSSLRSIRSIATPPPPSPYYMCDQHNEPLRFVCEYCKKLVCQCCTLHEHKDHYCPSIQSFVDESRDKIQVALQSSRMGTKCIKSSIDKALLYIRHVERNCAELSDNIRKAFRQFLMAIEDRERFLLEFVEKMRQRRLAILHEQMAGLKSALSGLAETSDMLHKLAANGGQMHHVDIAMKVTNGQRQLEQFAAIYKDLQPKQETFAFAAPDYGLLQDIRIQGGIILVDDKNIPMMNSMGGIIAAGGNEMIGALISGTGLPAGGGIVGGNTNPRRPLLRDIGYRVSSPPLLQAAPSIGGACSLPCQTLDWELGAMSSSPIAQYSIPRYTQVIPGSIEPVRARNSKILSLSFAHEGHNDGQVSRPWGLCVDKFGNIIVSDRRNNRVQVFNSDGSLKFKFGRKGVGNGEFDLPAGICIDIDSRIIVVDKDNHRVQIFTSNGVFLLKFGSYGKEYGQFQYPWDVAVNSRRQIVVTDSRNHRIQQFDSDGRFIRQIVFENYGQNKNVASPRGICYTPTGNIIVSDFDNHCLYLIDPDINEIISAKGHEGSGFQEFNRPSGLCCDDDGRIIVADSKNQRILVYSPTLEYLWDIEIRPSMNPIMPPTLDEKDRTCDVALMPDGRIVFLIELSPDSKEGSNPYKRFVHIY